MMIARMFIGALLTVSLCANAPDRKCSAGMGAAVPNAETARAIAMAVIRAYQKAEISKRYVLTVEPSGGSGWTVFQRFPPVKKWYGDIDYTKGGGGLEMHIDRCSGAISELYYQK